MQAAVKRGRGRPRKFKEPVPSANLTEMEAQISEADVSSASASTSVARIRTRNDDSDGNGSDPETPSDLGDITITPTPKPKKAKKLLRMSEARKSYNAFVLDRSLKFHEMKVNILVPIIARLAVTNKLQEFLAGTDPRSGNDNPDLDTSIGDEFAAWDQDSDEAEESGLSGASK